jgi:uracil-DNA glycosylase family 4
LCPRLAAYRLQNRTQQGTWWNAPVPSFGPMDAQVLIVGLAPGLRGANRTGRPFTGDFAGELLYQTTARFHLSTGTYRAEGNDDLQLHCRITNAVRCVPPGNRPLPEEIRACRPFISAEIAAMLNLRGIIALGRIAHETVVRALGLALPGYPFSHGALHELPEGCVLADSYHCSRQNTNTGRLTTAMFETVFRQLLDRTDAHCR